ncbi:unnamed protein product [Boreogadus saida]
MTVIYERGGLGEQEPFLVCLSSLCPLSVCLPASPSSSQPLFLSLSPVTLFPILSHLFSISPRFALSPALSLSLSLSLSSQNKTISQASARSERQHDSLQPRRRTESNVTARNAHSPIHYLVNVSSIRPQTQGSSPHRSILGMECYPAHSDDRQDGRGLCAWRWQTPLKQSIVLCLT